MVPSGREVKAMFSQLEIESHKPLRESVYEQLRASILRSEIKPNTRLKEVEIAEKMGVSRTPIREAIRKLEIEGLVTIESRKGAHVADISIKDTADTLDVRAYLEGLAARRAAELMTKDQIKELEKISNKFNKAVETGKTQDMIKYDEEFHRYIVNATDNPRLISILENLAELVIRFRYLYFGTFKRAGEMPPQHLSILEYIKAGDTELAGRSARNHIAELKRLILQEYDETQAEASRKKKKIK